MIRVRPAQATDLETLLAFSLGVAQESEGRHPPETTVRRGLEQALADPRCARYFVAEKEGAVVGALFVTFEWSDWNAGWYWWIQGVYVPPAARRSGVYRHLHEHVLATAAAEGVVDVRLYVEQDNHAARRTYEALGMTRLPYHVYSRPTAPPP